MIRGSISLIPLLLAASAGPVFAQSHAGHGTTPAAAQAAPVLPAGCVRRGSPTADAARIGTPGAPVCPAGSVPEQSPPVAVDPHAGHDMATMGQAQPAAAAPAGHDMSAMGSMPAGHDMSTMSQAQPAQAAPAGHDMSAMGSDARRTRHVDDGFDPACSGWVRRPRHVRHGLDAGRSRHVDDEPGSARSGCARRSRHVDDGAGPAHSGDAGGP